MKTLIAIAFVLAVFPAAADESFQGSVQPAAPPHPALYSFADVYRLTVSGGALGTLTPATGDLPIRVAATPGARAPEPQFSIVGLPQPRTGLLVLSGLLLAVWVARRRLGHLF
jgi:hypothetical protein